ncbi:hypothetical protein [Serratia symbiotica]|uniref:hypothetical protein n=1 Tax=Serratia symbiotica TaxID=138074 RepID=UPI003CC869BB
MIYDLAQVFRSLPSTKSGQDEVSSVLELRSQWNLGARRIEREFKRLHSISLAMATIHKVVSQNQIKPVVKFRQKADFIRYRVLRLYSRHTALNTLDFINYVIEEIPFPIQWFQTEWEREFFAVKGQKKLKECGIKFRPNKPASPHTPGTRHCSPSRTFKRWPAWPFVLTAGCVNCCVTRKIISSDSGNEFPSPPLKKCKNHVSWRGWHQDKRRDDRLSCWLSPRQLRVACSLSWLAALTVCYLLSQQQVPVYQHMLWQVLSG